MDLTDAQWDIIAPLFPPEEFKKPGAKGGRPWRHPREVLNGVLWILRAGCAWFRLPGCYPAYQTCHRRWAKWCKDSIMEKVLRRLAEDLRDRGKLDLTEAYIDGTHVPAKKGVLKLGRLAAGRQRRSWQWQTAMAFQCPLGLLVVKSMKQPSLSRQSNRASLPNGQRTLLATKRMTAQA